MKQQPFSAQVKILFGAEGIKKAYERSLESKRIDIVCLASQYRQVTGDYFDKKYAPRLYRSSIKTREILPDSKENRQYARKKDASKNQVRFLKGKKASESDTMLFENEAVLISYNKQAPYALVITDQELIKSLKNQFDSLWESLAE